MTVAQLGGGQRTCSPSACCGTCPVAAGLRPEMFWRNIEGPLRVAIHTARVGGSRLLLCFAGMPAMHMEPAAPGPIYLVGGLRTISTSAASIPELHAWEALSSAGQAPAGLPAASLRLLRFWWRRNSIPHLRPFANAKNTTKKESLWFTKRNMNADGWNSELGSPCQGVMGFAVTHSPCSTHFCRHRMVCFWQGDAWRALFHFLWCRQASDVQHT